MRNWFPFIVVFAAVELAVTTFVALHFYKKRMAALGIPPGTLDLRKIRELTDAIHPRIGEYVRSNWSGEPEALPGVLAVLVDQVAAIAREKNLALDRDVVKRLTEASLAKHGIVKGNAVREAMKQVA